MKIKFADAVITDVVAANIFRIQANDFMLEYANVIFALMRKIVREMSTADEAEMLRDYEMDPKGILDWLVSLHDILFDISNAPDAHLPANRKLTAEY